MTMTAPRRTLETSGPPPRDPGSRRSGGAQVLTLAELALGAITVAAVLGLGRLFADGSFLLPVLTVTVAAHLAASWCRRRGWGPSLTGLVAVTGLAAVVSWILLPDTTAYGLPTIATLSAAGDQLSEAMVTFQEVSAPAPVEPGFVLAAILGVWVIAFVADTAAFRAGAVVEAAVPAATLFVFGAALGSSNQRAATTAIFIAAVLAYWLAQRALANATSPTWLALDTAAGSRSLLRSGSLLGAIVVATAIVAGPLLPGADADALIPWRASERSSNSSRVTISPLVDIRARIVDQADSVVFTVASAERSYWRLTSLETFDGRIWSSNRSYESARGRLEPGTRLEPVPSERITQEFEIGALSSIWLPAAYRPVAIDGTSAGYDAESGSLIVPEDLDVTQSGQRYTIESVLPQLTGEELGEVGEMAPTSIQAAYTDLPEDFSQAVRGAAADITAGAPAPYDKALALQDHFRGGDFTYDLNVERGHSGDALEHFLFVSRTGYCEQFAGAFAAMARSVGLPARVAVGFTPGEQDEDGRFVVRGANGHAWPEVYLDGYGWVPFEPTPGRGIPGATEYTGVVEEQAAATDPQTATTLPATDDPLPMVPPQGMPTDLPDMGLEGMIPQGGGTVETSSPWPGRLLAAGLLLVGVPATWVVLVGAGLQLRRWRRRSAATTPEERIAVAWSEVGDALGDAGARPRAWETPTEIATTAAGTPGVEPALLQRLAGATSTAAYAPDGVDQEVADDAVLTATTLAKEIRSARAPRDRVRSAFDPRPLLPKVAGLRRIGAGSPERPVIVHRP